MKVSASEGPHFLLYGCKASRHSDPIQELWCFTCHQLAVSSPT